jgi:hypothetical protein
VRDGTPSVVLVTVDTTRADHLSMYGAEFAETPNLHALAHQGVTFDRAAAVTPITLPSHTSIHTGLYPPQHGVRNNGIHRADDSLTTLAERFADRGYATAAFVSAAVSGTSLRPRPGLSTSTTTTSRQGLLRFERMVPDRPASATVDAAVGWLDLGSPTTSPCSCGCTSTIPHAVYAPPQPFAERFRERPYDGEIAFMDRELGRLFAHPEGRRHRAPPCSPSSATTARASANTARTPTPCWRTRPRSTSRGSCGRPG